MNTDLLKQIKDEVAKDHEYIDFKHIFEPDHDHYSAIINEIAERYAAACVEEMFTKEQAEEACRNRINEAIQTISTLENHRNECVLNNEQLLLIKVALSFPHLKG